MNTYKKGFTLFEMMVSIGIFVMITTIGVLNYRKFGNDIFISNLAYDMALTIRKAQSYGINVKESSIGGGSFSYAYGVHFDISTATGAKAKYQLFVDAYDSSCSNTPDMFYQDAQSNCTDTGNSTGVPKELVETYSLLKGSKITSLCLKDTAGSNQCTDTNPNIDKIDITFLRPNPDAVIRNPRLPSTDYVSAEIHIKSVDNREKKITVYKVGQISVQSVTP